jgi:hypothetical protein
MGLEHDPEWKPLSNNTFERYKSHTHQNEIVLIGLDGGVKLRQNEFLGCEDLFAIIDGMPMRRRELKGNR